MEDDRSVTRGHEKAIWERFRGACDRFFTRRQEDLKQRKDEWAANLARKEALCARPKRLPIPPSGTRRRRAQEAAGEWKTIGPSAGRSPRPSGSASARLRSLLRALQASRSGGAQEPRRPRDDVIRELEALLPPEGRPADPPENSTRPSGRARPLAAGAGAAARVQQDLAARYHQALARLVAALAAAFAGTDLDPDATRKRMEKLVPRSRSWLPESRRAQAQLSPTELLAQQFANGSPPTR